MSEEKPVVNEQEPETSEERSGTLPDETATTLENANDPLKHNRSASVFAKAATDKCADALLPTKTQGVRVSRGGAAEVLHDAAKKAAASNSRTDVHEYMRIRRSYI